MRSTRRVQLVVSLVVWTATVLRASVRGTFLEVPLSSNNDDDGEGSNSSSGGQRRSGTSSSLPPPSWTLSNSNGSIVVPARVPGAVHLDLLVAGVLDAGDPYLDTNELAYAWVALEDWTYVLTLPRARWGDDAAEAYSGAGGGGGRRGDGGGSGSYVEDGRRRADSLDGGGAAAAAAVVGLLTFEGIDTFGTVRVNGRELGRSSNSFVPARFVLRGDALSELLTNQVSTVEVNLRSALVEARKRAATAAGGPNPPPDSVFFGDWAEPAHRNFARKAASDFGWDWGPAFVPAGLSGAVSLTVTDTGRLLQDVAVVQDWGKQTPPFPPPPHSSLQAPVPPPPAPLQPRPSSAPLRDDTTVATGTAFASAPGSASTPAASAIGPASSATHSAAVGAAVSSVVATDVSPPATTDASGPASPRPPSASVPAVPGSALHREADTAAADVNVVEVTVTAFVDGFDGCCASHCEEGRGGDAGCSGREALDSSGGRSPHQGMFGDVPSPATSSTLPGLRRKGVIFFSLSEPAEELDGGDGGETVDEVCVPLVLPLADCKGEGGDDGVDDVGGGGSPGGGDGGGDNGPANVAHAAGEERRSPKSDRGTSLDASQRAEEPVPVRAKMTVSDPQLWWPRGMNRQRPRQQQQQRQPLYMLRVDWYPGTDVSCPPAGVTGASGAGAADAAEKGSKAAAGIVAGAGVGVDRACGGVPVAPQSSVRRRIGLRKVELIREPLTPAAATTVPPVATPMGVRGGSAQVEDAKMGAATDVRQAPETTAAAAAAAGAGAAKMVSGGEIAGRAAARAGTVSGAGEASPLTAATSAAAAVRQHRFDVEESARQQQERQQEPQHHHNQRLTQEQRSQEEDGGDKSNLRHMGAGTGSDAGETMYFRVNGVPVFARGSNFVPPDAWGLRVSERKRRWLLESAAAANMNMVRVWGGGRTQPRSFYSACDELGLMVWQDLPYACALYPVADAPPPSHVRDANNGGSGTRGVKDFADDGGAQETPTTAEVATMAASAPAPPPQGNQGGGKGLAGSSTTPRILEDAAAEARAFVRRLSAHPSVVCWGGNNEVEQALGWFNESSSEPGRDAYERDYVTLFLDTIGNAVRSVDPFTPYVDSSPTNGLVPGTSSRPEGSAPGTKAVTPTRESAGESAAVEEPEFQASGPQREPPPTLTAQQSVREIQIDLKPPAAPGKPQRLARGGGAGGPAGSGAGGKRWGDPNDPRYGDVHFYDYDVDCEDADGYPDAMFVSEHGVQSFPSLDSYKQVTKPEDRWLGSPVMTFRQRHEGGDAQMSRQMRRHFDFRLSPEEERQLGRGTGGGGGPGDDEEALRAYLMLSQIQQGRCLEAAIGAWRKGRRTHLGREIGGASSSGGSSSSSRSNGTSNNSKGNESNEEKNNNSDSRTVEQGTTGVWEGTAMAGVPRIEAVAGTMGVLYWQLADTWQGPSWSTIEYDGTWKVSHHMVRRAFFSPLAIAGSITKRPRFANGQRTPPATGLDDMGGAADLRDVGNGAHIGDEGVDGETPEVETLWFECHLTTEIEGGVWGSYNVSAYLWDDRCEPVASWGGDVFVPAPGSALVFEAPVADMRSAAGSDRLIVQMVFKETALSGKTNVDERNADDDEDGNVAQDAESGRAESVYYISAGGGGGDSSEKNAGVRQPISADDLPETGLSWEILPGLVQVPRAAARAAVVSAGDEVAVAAAAEHGDLDHRREDPVSAAACEFTVRVRARAHAAHVTLRLEEPCLHSQRQEGQRQHRHQQEHQQRTPFFQPSMPPFHANDGGFHVFPCKARDIQIRYHAQDCGEAGISSAVKVESLKELLVAIEAGKRQPGGGGGGVSYWGGV